MACMGDSRPAEKLTYDSLMTVYYNLDRTKNDIRNIKNYLIVTLMNTPITRQWLGKVDDLLPWSEEMKSWFSAV